MNNEEQLKELEKKVDEVIKSDNADELRALSDDLAPLVKIQEAEQEAREQMQREEENVFVQNQVQNSNTIEKAKQKTFGTMKSKKNIFKNTNGFAEGFLFTLIIGFMSGAIFTIVYILFNAGKYSFIM